MNVYGTLYSSLQDSSDNVEEAGVTIKCANHCFCVFLKCTIIMVIVFFQHIICLFIPSNILVLELRMTYLLVKPD